MPTGVWNICSTPTGRGQSLARDLEVNVAVKVNIVFLLQYVGSNMIEFVNGLFACEMTKTSIRFYARAALAG